MPEELALLKARLRKSLQSKRDGLPEAARVRASIDIAMQLEGALQAASCIFIFSSFGSEVQTHALIKACLLSNQRVCLPLCGQNGLMRAIEVRDFSALRPGIFGILEPQSGAEVPKAQIDLALVPGLAFDRFGYRLGYGKGYYDRFLQGFSGRSIGLCYAALLQERLPTAEFDRAVGEIVTEKGILLPAACV